MNSISAAIRTVLVPKLQTLGFHGDFPRMLRLRDGAHDLVEFQISWRGGEFTVNLARISRDGVVWEGKRIPADEVTIGYVPYASRDRLRSPDSHQERWFRYLLKDGTKDFEAAASEVLPLIDEQLEERFCKLTFGTSPRGAP